MILRCVEPGDPSLDRLDAVCFPDDEPYDKHTPGTCWWVLYDSDKPVAFAGARIMPDSLYLCRAGVLPSHRGRHLQRRLIRVRTRLARRLGLVAITYTAVHNPTSANNLIACGFRMWTPARAWAGRGVLYWRRA